MKKLCRVVIPLLVLILMPWAMNIAFAQSESFTPASCSFTQFETGIDAGDYAPGLLNLSGDGSRLAVTYLINDTSPAVGFLVYDLASQSLIYDGSLNTSWGDIDYSGNHFIFVSFNDLTGENPDGNEEIFYWDNGVISQITNNTSQSEFGAPQISDDGSTVVFSANGSLLGDPNPERFIYIWDAVNGLRKLINDARLGDAGTLTDVLLSGDGSTVAFLHDSSLSNEPNLGETQIYLWDAVNGLRLMYAFSEDVSPYPFAFHINQDGSRIAFTDGINPLGLNSGGDDEIFIWDAATGLNQITQWDLDPFSQSASFSMDASGNRLFFFSTQAYSSEPENIEGGHFFYDEGFGYSQITLGINIGWPTWGSSLSADGQKLAILIPVGWDEVSNAAPFMEIFIGDCSQPAHVLPTPLNLTIDFTDHFTVALNWWDVVDDETSYFIERSLDGIDWVDVAELPADSITYTDTGLACDTSYSYRIRAYRASDGAYSEYSDIASGSISCMYLFIPRTLLVTNIERNSISLSWTDVNNSETGFRLERSTNGLDFQEIAQLPENSTTYTDNNLACNTVYYYRIRAYRSSDNQFSFYATRSGDQTLPCPVLSAPTNIAQTAQAQDSISLSWTDNSVGETAYSIERSQDGSNWEVLPSLPADSQSFTSTGLSCSTSYQFRIRSYDSVANSYSPYGSSAVFTTAACPALLPSVLSSTGLTETSIGLSWTVDNSATSFTLAYYDGLAWQNLAIFPATSTSYSHTGLACGTSYQYKVTTYRVNDNSTVESNVLPVSTSVCPAPNAPVVLAADLAAISLQIPALPAGASSMNLEQSSDGMNWFNLGAVSSGTFVASNLQCGTTYHYRLLAYGSNGIASAPSASAIGTTTACPTPSLIGVYRAGLWIIVSSDNPSVVLNSFTFGDASWQPIVGDWDGDGVEGVGIYRNGEFILKNLPTADSPETRLNFGNAENGWQAVAGDWNGDGIDSIGVYKNGVFSLSDNNQSEAYHFDIAVQGGWLATAGDWNGDGSDGVAVYKQGNWRLVDTVASPANQSLSYGPNQGGWRIIVGDWNNDNSDSIGLFKAGTWRIRTNNAYDPTEIAVTFGQEGDIPFVIEGTSSPAMFVVP